MPVKPDPPTRALGRAIADAVARRALFVTLHARDADRLLDHIQQVEAERDALADALRELKRCAGSHTVQGDYIQPDCGFEHMFMIATRALAALEEEA